MFSFGELILLGIIAIIFIGPKELPKVARYLGTFMREVRRIGYEFQRHLTAPNDEVKNISEDISKKINEAVGIEQFQKTSTDSIKQSELPGSKDSNGKKDDGGSTKH